MDMIVPVEGGPLAVDVTVVAARHGARDPHQYFARASRTKQYKYGHLQGQGVFSHLLVFSANPFGSLSDESMAFLSRILPDVQQRAQARARIALSIARGTARMMQCWSRRSLMLVANDG